MRRGRLEIATIGFNPNLALVASDPNGSPYDLGLFIGANDNVTVPTDRQLFMLCQKSFNAGQRGRLVGFRQYLTIGVQETSSTPSATYPLERPVETPTWKYVDGNVLWAIRRVPPSPHWKPNLQNADGLAYQWSETPAQLFQAIGGGVITPPYGGLFPGNVLAPELGRMFDLRCRRWAEPVPCDIPFEGPCSIAFMASVQQTDPSTRTLPPAIGLEPPTPVSAQISGNSALPGNSANEHWIVVTTNGAFGTIGQVYFDNGTGTGTVSVEGPTQGFTILPSTNFTGGTISLNAGQLYVWNGSAWVATEAGANAPNQFLTTQGTTPEDAFVQNYPGSTYFRIAGALIFEVEEQAPTGAPKTYRRPGDADRITRDTTEVGDNTMRRSAEDTSTYRGVRRIPSQEKRPATPPKEQGVGEAPTPKVDPVIAKLTRTWRQKRIGFEPGHIDRHKGVGRRPEAEMDETSKRAIAQIVRAWRQ